jgi:transposase-like protein
VGKLAGKTTRPGLYKCYACRKPFTVRMGTIFESSHLPLHLWLQVIHLMCASKKGIASRQIQRMLNCSMKTAWFLTHRIREAMKPGAPSPIGGENKFVEADETWIGGKGANRAFGPVPVKQAVMTLVERGGEARSYHVPNVTAQTLRPIIVKMVSKQSDFMTDDGKWYVGVGSEFASHQTVDHSWDEYVRHANWWAGRAPYKISTNTAEGYFSILKRGIIGVYHHVSEAHLHRYLAEFDFRYNTRVALKIDDVTRAERALKGVKGKRLTYTRTRRPRTTNVAPPPF